MREISHLNSAVSIINAYAADIPFAAYLKQKFKETKKFGSSDRRVISQFCYQYFRIARTFSNRSPEEIILTAIFLFEHTESPLLKFLKPEWFEWHNQNSGIGISEKIKFIQSYYPEFSVYEIFPLKEELSAGIEQEAFILSHLIQPDLFIRVRPGKENLVAYKLREQPGDYKKIDDHAYSLPPKFKIEDYFIADKDIVIQDLSSQRTAEYFPELNEQPKIWDCCAGSGGKSILAWDFYKKPQLTVSDQRSSILINLKKRFQQAGINKYLSFSADLTEAKQVNDLYDLVLADLPCSGSGTWGRNPENLVNFSAKDLERYIVMQKKILENIVHSVKPGGYLLYTTCSVYKSENETQVEELLKGSSLKLLKMGMIEGFTNRADTMFAAVFKSNES